MLGSHSREKHSSINNDSFITPNHASGVVFRLNASGTQISTLPPVTNFSWMCESCYFALRLYMVVCAWRRFMLLCSLHLQVSVFVMSYSLGGAAEVGAG